MNDEQKQKLYNLLDRIRINDGNRDTIVKIRHALDDGDYAEALKEIKILQASGNIQYIEEKKPEKVEVPKEEIHISEKLLAGHNRQKQKKETIEYPEEIADTKLERRYIGLLLNDVKNIAVYYFKKEDCFFADEELLEIYKQVIFTDGEKYAPEAAKNDFNFSKDKEETAVLKKEIKKEYQETEYSMERTFAELQKLFILRKSYLAIPVKNIQLQVADIINYELYNRMSLEEVESAVDQVTSTEKFKRAVLNDDLTGFIVRGDNALTNGLEFPFPILSSVFKGLRQGETTAFAMPSNAGKSRFTINLVANLALVHKKKVLLISNEMSEEKMRLCLTTTILNNPIIQGLHGYKMHITEGEILEFKFRPDEDKKDMYELDEKGYVLKKENETQEELAKRLEKCSTDFNNMVKVTDWFDELVNNKVFFINITDHTNDELKKVIMNYYYKEKVEYVFYDTLKTDIDNIGNGEEIKRTATVLANLAQNFKMFIGSTLQLAETNTDPINLNINDLAVSRTVKEVLDTLCLFKQIHNENLDRYEYSLNEVDTEFFPLEHFSDPDVRYYTCVVDKNRAGAKPKVVFRLNLAYNSWEELGYVRLKDVGEN